MRDVLGQETFESRFVRQFFIQRLLTIAQKMTEQQFYGEPIEESIVRRLLNDDFAIESSLQSLFGEGMILSFKKNQYREEIAHVEGVTVATYPEQLGYELLTKSMEEVFRMEEYSYEGIDENAEESAPTSSEKMDESVESYEVDTSLEEKEEELAEQAVTEQVAPAQALHHHKSHRH